KLLKEAFAKAFADQVNASDEAGIVERLGQDVHVVHGTERNLKITKPADMELARFYLQLERARAQKTWVRCAAASATICTGSSRAGRSSSGASRFPSTKDRWATQTATSWPMPFAMRCWAPPGSATLARTSPIPTRGGRERIVWSFLSTLA